MRARTFISFLLVVIALPNLAASQMSSHPSAQEVLTKWRAAVHAQKANRLKLAVLVSNSNQDGINGNVEEWITTSGDYRCTTKREFDDTEVVVTPQAAELRDWNGFVRAVQGKELSRLRTEIFEKRVIVFGPPTQMPGASVSQSDDKKAYLLQTAPPGGVAMTWYVDATTWLPAKSVRPGDDTEITTTYDDWLPQDEIMTPRRVSVSETDKPDYQWKEASLQFEKHIVRGTFDAPTPRPTDAFLDQYSAARGLRPQDLRQNDRDRRWRLRRV
jgi:hypothetical protein